MSRIRPYTSIYWCSTQPGPKCGQRKEGKGFVQWALMGSFTLPTFSFSHPPLKGEGKDGGIPHTFSCHVMLTWGMLACDPIRLPALPYYL
jgi:hypothetical protein